MRQRGTVLWFKEAKGFGFITPHVEGKDVFVHFTAIPDGVTLAPHDVVEYEVEPGPRGKLQAVRVTKCEPAAVAQ